MQIVRYGSIGNPIPFHIGSDLMKDQHFVLQRRKDTLVLHVGSIVGSADYWKFRRAVTSEDFDIVLATNGHFTLLCINFNYGYFEGNLSAHCTCKPVDIGICGRDDSTSRHCYPLAINRLTWIEGGRVMLMNSAGGEVF